MFHRSGSGGPDPATPDPEGKRAYHPLLLFSAREVRMLYDINSRKFQSYCNLECCPICLQQLGIEGNKYESIRTACGHRFHLACLDAHHKAAAIGSGNHECPVCRTWIGRGNSGINVNVKTANDPSFPTAHKDNDDDQHFDYETALERIYGSVACIFQLRAAHDVEDTSVAAELSFMRVAFYKRLSDPAFVNLVVAFVDATNAMIDHERVVATPFTVQRMAMAKDPMAAAQYSHQAWKRMLEAHKAKWSAVSYIYAFSGDPNGWLPFIEAEICAANDEITSRLAAACKKYDRRRFNNREMLEFTEQMKSFANVLMDGCR